MISELVDEKGIKIAISANWRFVIPSEVLRLIPSGILNLHVGRLPDYKEMRRRTGPSSPASGSSPTCTSWSPSSTPGTSSPARRFR